MRTKVSARVKLLLVANLLAGATLLASARHASAWETFCPPTASGCDCLSDVAFMPDGCYDNGGGEFLCSSNQFCAS